MPALMPVTIPPVATAITVAAELPLPHEPPVTEANKVIESPMQTLPLPVTKPAEGVESTVIVSLVTAVPQLLVTE